jgi:hypothetical protein
MDEVFHVLPTKTAAEELMQRRSDKSDAKTRRPIAWLDAEDKHMREKLDPNRTRIHVSRGPEPQKPVGDSMETIVHGVDTALAK